MLAPGALAVLQAISSYNSSMRIVEQSLAQAAQLSASEEVGMIAASREILTSLAAHPDVHAGTGSLVVAPSSARSAASISTAARSSSTRGRIHVRVDMLRTKSMSRTNVVSGIMSGDGFVISDLLMSRWLGHWGIVTAVPLVDQGGVIQGSIALFIGLDWLARRYQRGETDEDAAFALLDRRGEIITGDSERSPSPSPLPRKSLIDERSADEPRRSDADVSCARSRGTWRLYAISPLLEGRIFVHARDARC